MFFIRKYICYLFFLSFFQIVFAQPTVRGVLLKNKYGFEKGDTILLSGIQKYSKNGNRNYLLIRGKEYSIIRSKHVTVIDTIYEYWDKIWFENASGNFSLNNHDHGYRKDLRNEYRKCISNCWHNDLFLHDSIQDNYLAQLIANIYPIKLYKRYPSNLKIHVIKGDKADIFSFDNGAIFITTSLLASIKSEHDLVAILSKEMAIIVCDFQLVNYVKQSDKQAFASLFVGFTALVSTAVAIKSSIDDAKSKNPNQEYESRFTINDAVNITKVSALLVSGLMRPPKTNISPLQEKKSQEVSRLFLQENYTKMESNSIINYISSISSSLSFTAWQYYYNADYKAALGLINKVESVNQANSDDFLLKAKLYKEIFKTEEALYEALKYLKIAKESCNSLNVDIVKEEGLIYLKLHDKIRAKASFEEYKHGLENLQQNGIDDKDEMKWVNKILMEIS